MIMFSKYTVIAGYINDDDECVQRKENDLVIVLESIATDCFKGNASQT